jgi:hypothetical protein
LFYHEKALKFNFQSENIIFFCPGKNVLLNLNKGKIEKVSSVVESLHLGTVEYIRAETRKKKWREAFKVSNGSDENIIAT